MTRFYEGNNDGVGLVWRCYALARKNFQVRLLWHDTVRDTHPLQVLIVERTLHVYCGKFSRQFFIPAVAEGWL